MSPDDLMRLADDGGPVLDDDPDTDAPATAGQLAERLREFPEITMSVPEWDGDYEE